MLKNQSTISSPPSESPKRDAAYFTTCRVPPECGRTGSSRDSDGVISFSYVKKLILTFYKFI